MSSLALNVKDKEFLTVVKTFKHFHPGTRVDIQLDSESPLRIKGKLIGFDAGQFVIFAVSPQHIKDYPDLLEEGRGLVIRTIVEGVAGQCVAFKSNIQVIPARLKGLIFINYPSQIESISLRKESRMSTMLPVTIMHRDELNPDAMLDAKTELGGQIIDVSSGGCRVAVEWLQGQKKIQEVPVYLRVMVNNRAEPFILKAEIKSQTREDPATVSLGLMFVQDTNLKQMLTELGL